MFFGPCVAPSLVRVETFGCENEGWMLFLKILAVPFTVVRNGVAAAVEVSDERIGFGAIEAGGDEEAVGYAAEVKLVVFGVRGGVLGRGGGGEEEDGEEREEKEEIFHRNCIGKSLRTEK